MSRWLPDSVGCSSARKTHARVLAAVVLATLEDGQPLVLAHGANHPESLRPRQRPDAPAQIHQPNVRAIRNGLRHEAEPLGVTGEVVDPLPKRRRLARRIERGSEVQSFVATWLGVTCIFGSNASTSTSRAGPLAAARSWSRHRAQGP